MIGIVKQTKTQNNKMIYLLNISICSRNMDIGKSSHRIVDIEKNGIIVWSKKKTNEVLKQLKLKKELLNTVHQR
jgi:hypothetical protein